MEYQPTPASTARREKHRITYDADLVHSILDEALICHVGFEADGPVVLPMIHARVGEILYLHASTGSGLGLAGRQRVCLTATIVDGLVLAKSQFAHSMNYRCVVVRGVAEPVLDPDERSAALTAITEHVVPGRSADSRVPNARELAATTVLRIPLTSVSAKVRSGPTEEEEGDEDLAHWAGVIPVHLRAGTAEPAEGAPDPGPRFG